jgi:hypothetical protein
MDKEKDPKKHPPDNRQTLSRREFTMGSMAVLGTYSVGKGQELPPLPPEVQALKLEKSEQVQFLMNARHITDDDLKRVIDHAEKTGYKLYQPDTDRLLSKLWVNKVYFYAEYSPIEGGYRIHTAYSHRFLLAYSP